MKMIGSCYILIIACFFSCNNSIEEKDLDGIWSIRYIMKDSTNLLEFYNYTAGATFTNPLDRKVRLPSKNNYINPTEWRLIHDSIHFFNSEYGEFEGKYHIEIQDDTWRGEEHWLILKGDSVDLYFTQSSFRNGGPIDMNYYKKKR